MPAWLDSALIYQVYPRSFRDSDGDGIGDLAGITGCLEHLSWLGADAVWLSPIYPSPLADYGYDVSDHAAIAPEYGTEADFEAFVARAHELGLRVLLDLVVGHTSILHPWFREHPDRYIWSERGRPNNWAASFGGPAWSLDEPTGRWYLHSFFAEQPDLDWRNPELREAMAGVVTHWIERGVDGFRVDAADRMIKDAELRDDPPSETPFPLPMHPDVQMLDLIHSRDDPEIVVALETLREAAGESALIGEVYLPGERIGRYLEHLDRAFAFDLLHAPWEPEAIRAALEPTAITPNLAWVTSNHDFSRVASRWGEENARAAALLLLTLPGCAFIYQGEEIGMLDGPEPERPLDRFGRDPFRTPMQWTAAPDGGFGGGEAEPWLPLADPGRRNVAAQRLDPGSMLTLYRALIALRRELNGRLADLRLDDGLLSFRRDDHLIAINMGGSARPIPTGEIAIRTGVRSSPDGPLAPGEGAVVRTKV